MNIKPAGLGRLRQRKKLTIASCGKFTSLKAAMGQLLRQLKESWALISLLKKESTDQGSFDRLLGYHSLLAETFGFAPGDPEGQQTWECLTMSISLRAWKYFWQRERVALQCKDDNMGMLHMLTSLKTRGKGANLLPE
jgi:hypothetical protein